MNEKNRRKKEPPNQPPPDQKPEVSVQIESDFWSKLKIAVIGGIIGSLIPSFINLYVTRESIETNRLVMTGNNLQRDKELLMEQLFGVMNCYVAFSDEITEDSLKFDIMKLVSIYKKQWEFVDHLSVCAPSDICIKSSSLNESYLKVVQEIDKLEQPVSFSRRKQLMIQYTEDYHEWLSFVRIKIYELNLTTMPEMGDSSFISGFNEYKVH